MYIDRGKTDKNKDLVSQLHHETEQDVPDSICNSENVWSQQENVTSAAINSYIEKDSTIMEPQLYEKIDRISPCIHDKNLSLFAITDRNTVSEELNSSLSLLVNKFFVIQAALNEKHIKPRELNLAISLTKEN
jgi:hypothetical protein